MDNKVYKNNSSEELHGTPIVINRSISNLRNQKVEAGSKGKILCKATYIGNNNAGHYRVDILFDSGPMICSVPIEYVEIRTA